MKNITCSFEFVCWPLFNLFAVEHHVSSKGNSNGLGSKAYPFQTINYATSVAKPGDTITVYGGVYRELVALYIGGISNDKRIVYRAAPGEKVEIIGSDVVKGWTGIQGKKGLWQIGLPDVFFGSYNPFKELIKGDWFFPKKLLHTGEVFINGKALQEQVSWICKSENGQTMITANFGDLDPKKELVEITVRPSCFYPAKIGINYITVRGFHMSQAATQWAAPTAEQVGLIGTNWSKGWVIEDNVISDSRCVGITLGKDRASGHNVWSADIGSQ